MSFTGNVKSEVFLLDRILPEKISELSAILYHSEIDDIIKVTTENASVARFSFKAIKEIYDISPKITVRKGYNFKKGYIYILEIKEKIDLIIRELGLNTLLPPTYLYDDEDLERAYLRGVFLMTGSVNDPKTSRYHLEMLFQSEEYAKFIQKLLNDFRLNAKVIKKDNKYMVYLKEAEKISDFLKIINAFQAVLYYENIRIYKEQKNNTNRLNNCEQANIDRIIETCTKELKDIELIEEKMGLDLLDDKIKEACLYRKKYPEASLNELSSIISLETNTNITKSGLNHRFRKIREIANRLK